jgi:hypothetical protein
MFVAEVNAMNSEQHYHNIKTIQKAIEEETLGGRFDLEELADINDQMGILIESLGFWLAHGNLKRYTYDLKSFLFWVRGM